MNGVFLFQKFPTIIMVCCMSSLLLVWQHKYVAVVNASSDCHCLSCLLLRKLTWGIKKLFQYKPICCLTGNV